jgi:AcrR family transcriptional regulator
MPKRVDKEKKKEQILKAAIHTFAKLGVSNTKMSDIANATGMGKGTLYEYFRSKDEIFTCTFQLFMKRVEEAVACRFHKVEDPLEKLTAYFDAWIDVFESDYLEYIEIMLDFWAEGFREKKDFESLDINSLYHESRTMLENILKEGIERGQIKPVDTFLTASILLGSLDGLLVQWVFDKKIFDLKKAVQVFKTMLIDGLISNSYKRRNGE